MPFVKLQGRSKGGKALSGASIDAAAKIAHQRRGSIRVMARRELAIDVAALAANISELKDD